MTKEQLPSSLHERRRWQSQLEERIKLLETEREQVRATFLAYEGALQESKYWVSELTKTEEKNDG